MPPSDHQSVRLLLIEDDLETATRFINRVHRHAPGEFTITQARSLTAGIEEASDRPFSVAVIDQSLPDVVGIKACADFRERCPNTPVVASVATASELKLEVMSEAGARAALAMDDCDSVDLVNTLRAVSASATRRATPAHEIASEARFRNAVIDSSDGIVLIDGEGRIELVSEGAERLFGRPVAEVVGSNPGIALEPGKPFRTQLVRQEFSVGWPLELSGRESGRRHELSTCEVEFWPFAHIAAGKPVVVCAIRDITGQPSEIHDDRVVVRIESGLQVRSGIERECIDVLQNLNSLVEVDRFEAALWRPELRRLQLVTGLGAEVEDRDRSSIMEIDSTPNGFKSWLTGWSGEDGPERVTVSIGTFEAVVFDPAVEAVLSQAADILTERLIEIRNSPLLTPATQDLGVFGGHNSMCGFPGRPSEHHGGLIVTPAEVRLRTASRAFATPWSGSSRRNVRDAACHDYRHCFRSPSSTQFSE